jgi:DNA-binding winged helix-turn-helix (wHTH) protein
LGSLSVLGASGARSPRLRTPPTYRGGVANGVRIEVLGPVQVLRDGVPVRVAGRRQRLLLAVLVAERGRTVGLGRLVEALWSADGPAPKSPVNTVQQYVAALRTCLRPDRSGSGGDPGGSAVTIRTEPQGYRLQLPLGSTDLDDAHDLLGQCATLSRDGRPGAARSTAQRALDLWRGRPFEEFEAHPALGPVLQDIRRLHLDVSEAWVLAAADLGDHPAVVALLAPQPRTWQARESLAVALVTSLAALGRHVQARAAAAAYRAHASRRGAPVSRRFCAAEAEIAAGHVPRKDRSGTVRHPQPAVTAERLRRLAATAPVSRSAADEPTSPTAQTDPPERAAPLELAEFHLALAGAANDPAVSADRGPWQTIYRRHAAGFETSLAWATHHHPEVGVDLACELALWWDWSGQGVRLRGAFTSLLSGLPSDARTARGRCAAWLAFSHADDDTRIALRHIDIAVHALREDPLELGRARAVEAVVARAVLPDRALDAAEAAARLLSGHGTATELGYAHVTAALAALQLENRHRARRHLGLAEDLYRTIGDQRGLAWVDIIDARLDRRPPRTGRDFHARLGDTATGRMLAEA